MFIIEMSLNFWNREWQADNIKAEWRFFEPSEEESGRMAAKRTHHVPPSPRSLFVPIMDPAIVPLLPSGQITSVNLSVIHA
jgi:hypothetical protein